MVKRIRLNVGYAEKRIYFKIIEFTSSVSIPTKTHRTSVLPRRFLLPHFLKLVQNETEGDEAEDGSLPVKRVAVDSPQNFEVNALLNDLNDPSGFEEPKSMFQNNEAMAEEAEYTAASNRLLKEMNAKLDDLTKKISEFQITAKRTRQESNSCQEDELQAGRNFTRELYNAYMSFI